MRRMVWISKFCASSKALFRLTQPMCSWNDIRIKSEDWMLDKSIWSPTPFNSCTVILLQFLFRLIVLFSFSAVCFVPFSPSSDALEGLCSMFMAFPGMLNVLILQESTTLCIDKNTSLSDDLRLFVTIFCLTQCRWGTEVWGQGTKLYFDP